MNNIYEVRVLYGGIEKGNKRDKASGAKLAEEYARVVLLELDEEKKLINSNTFYVDVSDYEKYDKLNIKLLEPVVACVEFSISSNYKKLVDIKPIKNNVIK